MEAFSDGVIAIVITIMVLQLPRPVGHEWTFIAKLWPTLLSYIISFVYVGIYWNNHHHLMHTAKRISGKVLWANLQLLFWLSLFPYVTDWAGTSHFSSVPMTCYGFVAFMCAVSYSILVRTIAHNEGNDILVEAADHSFLIKQVLSLVMYVLSMALPFFGQLGAYASGVTLLAVALMWLVPERRMERAVQQRL